MPATRGPRIDRGTHLPYPGHVPMPNPLADRLEMLLVVEWLEAGAPPDGGVGFRVAAAAAELGCADGRAGLLEIMGALGELEEAGRLRVEWPPHTGAPALVQIAEDLRRDAQRVFLPPSG